MSIYGKSIARSRPLWIIVGISILLLVLPLGAASLDGILGRLFSMGQWRPIFLSPVVIIYILFVSQLMSKADARMISGFRKILIIDEETLSQVTLKNSTIHPMLEVGALIIGFIAGILMGLSWTVETFWLRIYVITSLASMYGMLFWTIICLVSGTRLISALHRQPMDVNILDIRPFEPVGRHSLTTSMVFVGGVILAMIFGLDRNNLLLWQTWAFILPLFAVPALIFFLNMRHTHRILNNEKKRQLTLLTREIGIINLQIQAFLEKGEIYDAIFSRYAALVLYEARVKTASTWPYNTSMLRTLIISIFLPLITRGISFLIFGQ